MPSPDDPVIAGFGDCVYGHFDEGFIGSVVPVGDGKGRAAAQRRFADELGVDFGDVRSFTTHGRILDRQEAYEQEWEDKRDDAIDELGYIVRMTPWDYADGAPPDDFVREFWYEHADSPGVRVGDAEVDAAVEATGLTARVPDDWEPSENIYAWQTCAADHPDAVKLWIFE